MAAYAAVVSLMNTIEQIMNHPRLSTSLDKKQTQSLDEKLGILLEFIENYSSHSHGGSYTDQEEAEFLERKIASAAHMAEDVIESHIVDQIQAGVLENAPTFFLDLHQIIQDIDQVKEEVVKVEEKNGTMKKKRKYSIAAASSELLTTAEETTMIGFDGYSYQLLDGLTGNEAHKQVIPIVGMGGIGKTTLARNAYENFNIVRHFDVRAWVTISQNYNVRKIFIQLLSSLGQVVDENLVENNEARLSERLHKFLCGRRYLIVLDDMWSFTVWERIMNFFPEDYNRSRIVVTTRLLEVANYFGSSRLLVMELLDDDKSWDLFCLKAFAQHEGCCPDELEQIGKRIVKKCQGLPLSIVVIGGLLGKSSPTKEYWENVVGDINSILNSADDNQCFNILSLSYNHLPPNLKPCFLYLGIFPEDHEMHVSRLIKLWVAEGFIKPGKNQRLEDVAESYMSDLFGRNLILVGSLGWNRKCETFFIHDLLRDLCLIVAEKEKFFCVTKTTTTRDIDMERRVVIREGSEGEEFDRLKSTSTARSLIGKWGDEQLFECRLLRVMVADYDDDRNNFPEVAFEQANMRLLHYKCVVPYVTLKGTHKLSASISKLWNLQTLTLVFDGFLESPPEIWKLRQLRHLEFWNITIPEPPSSEEEDDDDEFVLHNLHTLVQVENLQCSLEVCKRIPNIRKLHLSYSNLSEVQNLGCLSKLESLFLGLNGLPVRDMVQNLEFPTSLRELSLFSCGLDWDQMNKIGWLPHLEFLQIQHNSFTGEEWNPVEGGFLKLKYLEIGSCFDFRRWNSERCHFPVLDTLVVKYLPELEEIPWGVGNIATLTLVCVEGCRVSLAVSAMKILEEQESLGNDGLKIEIKIRVKTDVEVFVKEVEMEGIDCTNFKLIDIS